MQFAEKEGPDQPVLMLIRACIVHKLHKGPFVLCTSYVFMKKYKKKISLLSGAMEKSTWFKFFWETLTECNMSQYLELSL